MQNIINKLQDIIKTHYGYNSELEWKPLSSYQSLKRETYSTIDRTLSVPIFEPQSQRPIAYFKILNIQEDQITAREKLCDLVQVSLQSYINLIDQLDISENLIQYLQIELQPQKIIRLQSELARRQGEASLTISPSLLPSVEDLDLLNKEALLIKTDSALKLERLALAIHTTCKNNFFIRTDHLAPDFLNSINDLLDLHNTTLFIPDITQLTPLQQKTIETYFLLKKKSENQQLLIVCGTLASVGDMIKKHQLNADLLKSFDFFYILGDAQSESELHFDSLGQCAHAILQSETTKHFKHHRMASYTKSCHIIPSCKDLFPTLH